MNLFNKIKNLLLVALFSALLVTGYSLKQTISEKNRLNSNQTALFEKINFFKTSDSLNAASVQRLVLEKDEFKKYNADLNKTVESLNIKLKRLQSASVTAIETKYEVKVNIKDSVRIRDSVPEPIKCIDFKDNWITIEGCFEVNDLVFEPYIVTRDTIKQTVDRVPREFWFIKYGAKGIRQTVVTSSPYSKPVYTKYIEFKK